MRGVVTLAEDVKLVPLGELDPVAVGQRINQLIYGGRGGTPDHWVADDFPQMVPHYRTPEAAEARIRELVKIARESDGDRGFLAVTQNDAVIGMVTYGQEKLETKRGPWPFRRTTVHADGPLVACWLGRREWRPRPHPYVLPTVLRQLAVHMVGNSVLRGRPWTLVRTGREDHGHVDGNLLNANNGFGGFEPTVCGAFSHVDGVEEERRLYVGRHLIETMRG